MTVNEVIRDALRRQGETEAYVEEMLTSVRAFLGAINPELLVGDVECDPDLEKEFRAMLVQCSPPSKN